MNSNSALFEFRPNPSNFDEFQQNAPNLLTLVNTENNLGPNPPSFAPNPLILSKITYTCGGPDAKSKKKNCDL
jgi:hypothetical protein